MRVISSSTDLQAQVQQWRAAGQRIAFVPTMGNLHTGHLQLVDVARAQADKVIVSIFVNPTQFGPNEDFASYPRTLDEDLARLTAHNVDIAYVPDTETLYPGNNLGSRLPVLPGLLATTLCGASRPGFFQGVANVVDRLFTQVNPDLAVFGEKDFQQLLVVRWLVKVAHPSIEIVSVPTVREADGLAMSSRNAYLTQDERAIAPMLYSTLQQLALQCQVGEVEPALLERQGMETLTQAGFTPDYLSIRRAIDLSQPDKRVVIAKNQWVILAAAWLGRARLIDNLFL